MDPSGNPEVPAQWTHEAAHEGVVPLCEDDIRNPQIPWVSAQWTHEAAREGWVRLGYLEIPSCSVSQQAREEDGISVRAVTLRLYLLQHATRFQPSHGMSFGSFTDGCCTCPQTSGTCSLPGFSCTFLPWAYAAVISPAVAAHTHEIIRRALHPLRVCEVIF